MGGAVAAWACRELGEDVRGRVTGVVLLAPALGGSELPPTPVVWGLKLVHLFYPSAALGPPEHGEIYDTGSGLKLNYEGNMRLCTAKMFLDLHDKVAGQRGRGEIRLDFPVLWVHGAGDRAVSCAWGKDFFDQCCFGDKEFLRLVGRDHQPICEDKWEEVLESVVQWVRGRL
eukprot:CAMPEP_0204338206 /NCGR_PEP_ID=MMETSP0469-20131031/20897_1 /ASSEMBLY_ACC=CAM_ASM_000384 /TAXON_ID=2969 /ORGANISM="Oxyrrhis marina" /LENGTH=171 /DNA_ID=CAMNT_0051322347 /DNA_START=54 /DNA_END=569 /DNA_ORIENTATION=-